LQEIWVTVLTAETAQADHMEAVSVVVEPYEAQEHSHVKIPLDLD